MVICRTEDRVAANKQASATVTSQALPSATAQGQVSVTSQSAGSVTSQGQVSAGNSTDRNTCTLQSFQLEALQEQNLTRLPLLKW